MNETKPKKMVSKNVAVSLGIICIILIALIAYFTVTGISAQNSYNNLENQNKQLQANNINLQNQVNNLSDITALNKSDAWAYSVDFNASECWNETEIPMAYAGYIWIRVQSSTNNTYVRVTWSSFGDNFDQQTTVGANGTVVFPVLPSTPEIRVGNTSTTGNTTESATILIVYYY